MKLQDWHFTSKTKSSHWKCSLKKNALKKFAKFTGKHLCWSLFFRKVTGQKPATLLKKDSNTGVFLLILRNFQEHLFQRTYSGNYFAKPLCTTDPEISGCFLIQILLPWCLICLMFKNIKMFKQNLKLTAQPNSSAL